MYRHLFKQLCIRCLLGAASTASWEEGICGGDDDDDDDDDDDLNDYE